MAETLGCDEHHEGERPHREGHEGGTAAGGESAKSGKQAIHKLEELKKA
jgi:hypothetical protein